MQQPLYKGEIMNFLTKQGFVLLLIFIIFFYIISSILNFLLFFKNDIEFPEEKIMVNEFEFILYLLNPIVFNRKSPFSKTKLRYLKNIIFISQHTIIFLILTSITYIIFIKKLLYYRSNSSFNA